MLDSSALVPTSRECYISKFGSSELGSVPHTDTGQAWSEFPGRPVVLSGSWTFLFTMFVYLVARFMESFL